MRKEFSTAVHHHSVWKTPTIVSFFIVSKVKPNHFQLKTRETNEKRAVQSLFIFYLAWEIEWPRDTKLLFYSWPTAVKKKLLTDLIEFELNNVNISLLPFVLVAASAIFWKLSKKAPNTRMVPLQSKDVNYETLCCNKT